MTFGGSPVGRTIGPALEVREALTVLENKGGPNSLKEKSLSLAGILLEMGGVADAGMAIMRQRRFSPAEKPTLKLMEIIGAQGGNSLVKSEDIVIGDHCEDIWLRQEAISWLSSIKGWWSWPVWQVRPQIRRQEL